jgi:hypothetical protein
MLANRTAAVADTPPSRQRGAELPSRQRARRTNDPLANLDMNTARGRRVADLVRAYLHALGNPSDVDRQAAIIAAAEMQVLAEEARASALKQPGTIDLDQVVKIQGAADRAVRRLGIKPTAPKPDALREYLERHAANTAATVPASAPASVRSPDDQADASEPASSPAEGEDTT